MTDLYQCPTCGRGSDVPYTCDPVAIEFEVLYRTVAGEARFRFTEVQRYIFRNALEHEGIERAEQFLRDWGLKEKKQAWITKWIPGDHYYAEGEKFESYWDACDHLRKMGFEVLGLKETKVEREGD